MKDFNRYRDDKYVRAHIILEETFKAPECDKVMAELKELIEKINFLPEKCSDSLLSLETFCD